MLFNSLSFLFEFLPIVVGGGLLVQRFAAGIVLHFLIVASLFFYGFWNPTYLGLIGASLAFNFAMSKAIRSRQSNILLALAIGVNLALLGYFKYFNFFVSGAYWLTGWQITHRDILLPLAISFFTFEQISFLVDSRRGTIGSAPFVGYAFFSCFFPKLIAGPIVRYSELEAQGFLSGLRITAENFSPGLTLLVIGLAKKVLLADQAATYVNPVFDAAAIGNRVATFDAWLGSLAYTVQIYFDFSGYSDMALGLALMFGLRLPINFDSPYKSLSIIEFWRRWHITLSRFLRDYLYIPLGGNRSGGARRYANLIVVMLLGGMWHGAGLTFICWGGLHGLYLVINHVFREAIGRGQARSRIQRVLGAGASWLITFVAVVVAWVFFRASTIGSALELVAAMFGMSNGAAHNVLINVRAEAAIAVAVLLVIALVLPNSNDIIGRGRLEMPETVRPAVKTVHRAHDKIFTAPSMVWRPTVGWAIAAGAVAVAVLATLTRPSPFLYFQF